MEGGINGGGGGREVGRREGGGRGRERELETENVILQGL